MILRFVCLIFLCCIFSDTSSAQNDFPASWQGAWKGQLMIYTGSGLAQELPMELHIFPLEEDTLDRYTWTIIYGTDKEAGKRDYLLEPVRPELGIFRIDEQNDIAMEAYLLNGKFYQRFEVMGNLLLTTTEKQGDRLIWEIISGKMDPVSVTGDTIIGTDTIPPVSTLPIQVLQRAELRRE